VKRSDESTLQREQLNPAWLKQGENRITFSLPDNAGFGYNVKNLSIEIEKGANSTPLLAVNTSKNSYGNKAYIYGFIQGTNENATIHIARKEVVSPVASIEEYLTACRFVIPHPNTTKAALAGGFSIIIYCSCE
jgi:hypothetical protein